MPRSNIPPIQRQANHERRRVQLFRLRHPVWSERLPHDIALLLADEESAHHEESEDGIES